uniref:C2H2-type domain-containing protein n=1 Tax=Heterorhabditis bacteriophora TaxID=37862 RepID=A0A1I7X8Q1_HETBA
MEHLQRKYDDIFSCVVQKALANHDLRLSPPPIVSFKTKVQSGKKPKNRKLDFHHPTRSVPKYESLNVDRNLRGSDSSVSLLNSVIDLDNEECNSLYGPSCSERRLQCECGQIFKGHIKLHEHLASEVPLLYSFLFNLLLRKLGVNSCNYVICLINNLSSRICGVFSVILDDHLKTHYQDRTSSGALMECRWCYKTFPTLIDVRRHERISHGPRRFRGLTRYFCQYCQLEFSSRHLRDGHLVGHFDSIIGGIWEKIANMQEILTDQLLVNQCPICHSIMGSRKSFRLHIVHKHLVNNPERFMIALGLSPMTLFLNPFKSPVLKEEKTAIAVKEELSEGFFQQSPLSIKEEPDE